MCIRRSRSQIARSLCNANVDGSGSCSALIASDSLPSEADLRLHLNTLFLSLLIGMTAFGSITYIE